jgi:hypothetical protein
MPVTTRNALLEMNDDAYLEMCDSLYDSELTVHYNDKTPYTYLSAIGNINTKYYKYKHREYNPKELESYLDADDYETFKSFNLPQSLIDIYESLFLTGLNNRLYHIRWNNWKFLSITHMLDLYEFYLKNGQDDLIDIAYFTEPTCYYSFKLCLIPSVQKFVVLQDLKHYNDGRLFSNANYTFTSKTVTGEYLFDFQEAFKHGGIFNTLKRYPLANDIFYYRHNLLEPHEMMSYNL